MLRVWEVTKDLDGKLEIGLRSTMARFLLDSGYTRGRWNSFSAPQSLACTSMMSMATCSYLMHDDVGDVVEHAYAFHNCVMEHLHGIKKRQICLQLAVEEMAKTLDMEFSEDAILVFFECCDIEDDNKVEEATTKKDNLYEQNDNAISIVLSAPYTTGWVGMAFSENEFMVGSSAMVGWIQPDGSGSIKQYYLGGKSADAVVLDDTHLVVINNSSSVQLQGSTIYLAFQLLFAEPVKSQNLLYAYGSTTPSNNQLSKHSSEFHTTLDFTTGTSSTSSSTDTMKRNHGALNIFAWGVLLPIGAIIARYFRQWEPAWFYMHIGFQVLGFIFGVAGVVLGVALYNRLDSNVRAHRGLGIFILVLGILQVLALLLRPQKEAKVRKYWNWYHQWFGRLALFLAAVNIVYGIRLAEAGQTWKVGYGFVLAILLLVVIVLETIFWIKWFRRPTEPPAFQMYNSNA